MYLFIMMQQDFVSLQTEILILFYVSMLNLANLLFKEVYFLGSWMWCMVIFCIIWIF